MGGKVNKRWQSYIQKASRTQRFKRAIEELTTLAVVSECKWMGVDTTRTMQRIAMQSTIDRPTAM